MSTCAFTLPVYIIIPFKRRFGSLAFSVIFPHVNPVCPLLLPCTCYAFRPSHPLLRTTPKKKTGLFEEDKKSFKLLIMQFYPSTCFFLQGPNISFNTLRPNTDSLSSSPNLLPTDFFFLQILAHLYLKCE